jgi:hypothetical protein
VEASNKATARAVSNKAAANSKVADKEAAALPTVSDADAEPLRNNR